MTELPGKTSTCHNPSGHEEAQPQLLGKDPSIPVLPRTLLSTNKFNQN